MTTIFDESANQFARSTDLAILRRHYVRGHLFLAAVRKWVPRGGRLLDYGCGPGRLARLIAQEGYPVTAVDPSSGMIHEASRQNLNGLDVTFSVGTCPSDAPGAPFAGAICSSVIEYETDPVTLLSDLAAVLSQGAPLILSFANARSLWRQYANWKNPRAPYLSYQHQIWTAGDCQRALESAGFSVIEDPQYFESPLDSRPRLAKLSSLEIIGTLGLIVASRS